ncbi:MAG: hypothetical protein E6J29_07010 [Chloroflexi bacterium]|nr:MAG: hypothetical protein E6J29_07010 [Chloroflexota bacterium]TMD52222.1 MAG: hypothetical protein E6I85_11160 [Chloroflexota bacterium]
MDELALIGMTDGKLVHLLYQGDDVTLCGRHRAEELVLVADDAPGAPSTCPECAERAQVAEAVS